MRLKKKNTGLFKITAFALILLLSFIMSACSNAYPNDEQNTSQESSSQKEEISSSQISKEPEPEKIPKTHYACLTFTGDLMVHSYQYEEAYDRQTGEYDFEHNFSAVKKYFDKSDYTIGNLETVFAGGAPSDYPLFNTPDSFAEALKNAGFDFLTTANNHCCDMRQAGLLRTIDILDGLSIDHAGTYKTEKDRDKIFIKDINGITFAFLSYTYGTNGMPYENDYNVFIR